MSRIILRPQARASVGAKLKRGLLAGAAAATLAAALLSIERLPDGKLAEQAYYFSPTEDYFFENPANWRPSYPGTQIPAGARVMIHDRVCFGTYPIRLAGVMELSLEATLYSAQGSLHILPGGKLINHGDLMAARLDNGGQLLNELSGEIFVHEYQNSPESITWNQPGGQITVSRSWVNRGEMQNYGICFARLDFRNEAELVQAPRAEFYVRGERLSP
jgi:hypothetical protein